MGLAFPLAFVLIGLGALAAGATGLALPPDQRLAAGLPLLAGAGAGVTILGIGWALLPPAAPPGTVARLFLLASIIGLATVAVGLVSLWRRATREAGRPGSG